ncbi:hypothetical protein ACXGQW_03010 [Wenyingzhuangia sp. IMCC45533]
MKTLLHISIFMFTLGLMAQKQPVSDQNPNHQISYQKYLKDSSQYTNKQGTTENQTYVAIDPMEEKRIRKKTRKEHRSMRGLWRHQERLERAKNTKYYRYTPSLGFYPNFGYRNLGFGFSNHLNYRNSGLGCTYFIR